MQIIINILIGINLILLLQLILAIYNKELSLRYEIYILAYLTSTPVAIYLFFMTFALGDTRYFFYSLLVFFVPAILIQITDWVLYSKLSTKEKRQYKKEEREDAQYRYDCDSHVH